MRKILEGSSPGAVIAAAFAASLLPILLVAAFGSVLDRVMDPARYLVFHNAAEFFSIMVSLSLFSVGWFTYEQSKDSHALFLSAAFLAIGLLDFMHALSYSGMPAFFTPNSPDKSTRFWIAARFFSATVFLASAYVGPECKKIRKIPLLIAVMLFPASAFVGIVFFPEYLPVTYVEGEGLTPFKQYSEYLIIAIFFAAALKYWKKSRESEDRALRHYVAALILCMASEFVFALYHSVFDTYNVLGHLYKILAFFLIYMGIFSNSVRDPYKRLVTEIGLRTVIEDSLARVNRALRTLSAANMALVHAEQEKALLDSICKVIVESGGYRMAWVGYAVEDEKKSIRPAAHYGIEKAYLEAHAFSWGEGEHDMELAGLAIRSGEVQVSQDILQDPRMSVRRESAIEREYASCIALPLGELKGALTIYGGSRNAFGEDEMKLLAELAGDLSYGIQSLRARVEQEQSRSRLQANMQATIQAISSTIEMRDPYTAGHQKRVAELGSALGRMLGLSEDQIHGIYLAGIVHDLGKLNVPAEILAKPGKLSDLEYELIKFHPRAGYDILKGIDFPWPVAQAVLQHHERLDGSGYPAGLKGDEILLEARILAVADVVEAMYSHRPYRAGLGKAVALREISEGRGGLFDPEVVDACIRLFEEKGFSFS